MVIEVARRLGKDIVDCHLNEPVNVMPGAAFRPLPRHHDTVSRYRHVSRYSDEYMLITCPTLILLDVPDALQVKPTEARVRRYTIPPRLGQR